MMRVPSGYFLRGVDAKAAHETEESPQTRVWLDEYQIQRWPVTVSQWLAFLEESHHEWPKEEWIRVSREKQVMPEILDDAPITWVNWHDCKAFADWLTSRSGRKYSLPTENQWEKACRGVNGQRYPWSDACPNWQEEFTRQADSQGHVLLRSIGKQKQKATPFGVEEMWCNVQEWCDDWFLLDWVNPGNPDNEQPGQYKAVRGGNTIAPGWPRCAARQRIEPTYRSYILGFRLVTAVHEAPGDQPVDGRVGQA